MARTSAFSMVEYRLHDEFPLCGQINEQGLPVLAQAIPPPTPPRRQQAGGEAGAFSMPGAHLYDGVPNYDDISDRFPGSPDNSGAAEPDLAVPGLKLNGLRPQPELACRHAAAAARHATAAARHATAAAKLAGLRLPSSDGARRITKQRAHLPTACRHSCS